MNRLLHLDASHGRESVSRALAGSYADAWRRRFGEAGYLHRDLSTDPVPALTEAYVALTQRAEEKAITDLSGIANLAIDEDERHEWDLTVGLIRELIEADTLLIGTPMYNFSIPASLKAWIDRITVPGVFTDPANGQSLLRDTEVVVLSARGGAYGPGTPRESYDFQEPYLRCYFTNLGVPPQRVRFVHAEMTRAGFSPVLAGFEQMAADSLAAARRTVSELSAGAPGSD